MIVAIVCQRRTAAVSSPRPIRRRSPTALPQAGEGGEGQRRHAVEAGDRGHTGRERAGDVPYASLRTATDRPLSVELGAASIRP